MNGDVLPKVVKWAISFGRVLEADDVLTPYLGPDHGVENTRAVLKQLESVGNQQRIKEIMEQVYHIAELREQCEALREAVLKDLHPDIIPDELK